MTLLDEEGKEVELRDLLHRGPLVIYFYPKDDTLICTAQACGFRDEYRHFSEAGAEVIGISADPPSSHRAFASKHGLPFRLLSDPRGEASDAFGVKRTLGILAGRATFVCDRGGAIRLAHSSAFQAAGHVRRALEVVRSLAR